MILSLGDINEITFSVLLDDDAEENDDEDEDQEDENYDNDDDGEQEESDEEKRVNPRDNHEKFLKYDKLSLI